LPIPRTSFAMDAQQTPLTTTWDSEADEKSAVVTVPDRQGTSYRRWFLYGLCAGAIVSAVAVGLMGHSRSSEGDNIQMAGFMSADNVVDNTAGNTDNTLACDKDVACKLKLSTVTNQNLLGADSSKPANLRYGDVCTVGKKKIDMVVTASKPYEAKPGKNGLSGKFGSLNLKADTSTTFKFSFYESGTEKPVTLDSLKFSVFDFDGLGEKSEKQYEKVTFTGFSSYTLGKGSKLKEEVVAGGVAITSTEKGNAADNPTDPMTLSSEQQQRSISLVYTSVSDFSMKCEAGGTYKKGYRNFVFAGESAVKGECKPPPKPTGCTPTVWMSAGPGTVCRLSKSDTTLDGQGSAVITTAPTLAACKEKCKNHPARCYGVEYGATVKGVKEHRCEIWTKPAGHVTKCNAHTTGWDNAYTCDGTFECLGFWCPKEAEALKKKIAEQNKIADR